MRWSGCRQPSRREGPLWRAELLQASRFGQSETLYRAGAKFQPEWVPRFLCSRSAVDLPGVSLAAMRAEAFIVAPAWWRNLDRRSHRRPSAAVRDRGGSCAGRRRRT